MKQARGKPAPKSPESSGNWRAVWRRPLAPRLALCAITLAAYANSFGLGLVRDGQALVTADPRVKAASWENFRLILNTDYWWPSSVGQVYRPVTTASFLLNYVILGNGESPAGYHALNVVLHLGNVWLVYELALLVMAAAGPAFFAAALWAVHPLGTECVANVAGRADLLATMAVLGGLLLYIRMASAQGRRMAWAACGLFAVGTLGVFSKETGVAVAGLVLLWDITYGEGHLAGLRRRIPLYTALAAALALLWYGRQRVFNAEPWPQLPYLDNPLQGAPFWTARLSAIETIGRYRWLLVCPLQLSSDRNYDQIPLARFSDISAWLSLLLVAGLLAAALLRYRRDRLAFWSAGFFAIALLPSSNLVLVIGSNMAERFLYLPSVAFAVLVVALAYRVRRKHLAGILLTTVIVLFGIRTFTRNADWASNLSLASADAQVTPRSFSTHALLAHELYLQSPERNLDRAIQESETAWAILQPLRPVDRDEETPANLGLYYRLKGDRAGGPNTAEGRVWYQKSLSVLLSAEEASRAIEKAYDDAQIAHGRPLATRVANQSLYLYLAGAYAGLGQYPDALAAYANARTLNPAMPSSYDGIASVHLAQGDPVLAALAIDEKVLALGLTPDSVAALQKLYERIPNGACALAEQGGEVRLNPGCPVLHDHLCRAWAELTSVFSQARLPQAVQSFRVSASQQGCSEPRPGS